MQYLTISYCYSSDFSQQSSRTIYTLTFFYIYCYSIFARPNTRRMVSSDIQRIRGSDTDLYPCVSWSQAENSGPK